MGMSFLCESHGKRPMGWDGLKLLWDGNRTDKYVLWTTLAITAHNTTHKSGVCCVTLRPLNWKKLDFGFRSQYTPDGYARNKKTVKFCFTVNPFVTLLQQSNNLRKEGRSNEKFRCVTNDVSLRQ